MTGKIPQDAALIVLGPGGLALAKRLKPQLPGSDIHGLRGRADEVDGADETFTDTMAHVAGLFRAGRPIIGVCAAGILIRAVAGLLSDKRSEPAVVALAEDGSCAVPLLGGHHGANRLAIKIADITGGQAAVTTAGDVGLGLALDDPPPGWCAANPMAAKKITQTLLAGGPVALVVEAGDAGWIAESGAAFTDDAPVAVRVTDRAVDNPADDLILHPPVLALGVGCERGADASEVIDLAEATLKAAGLAAGAVASVVSLDLKADEGAVHALADHLGVPARFFDAETLEVETPRLANPSDVVFTEVGCHGVSEGAALACVGADGQLVVEKKKSARATCAIARAPGNIHPEQVGRAQGVLTIVGIGPGASGWRTPEATAALNRAEDVVGYALYLDLVADLIEGTPRHSSELGREEDRARRALDLAATGRRVALVCSGDAGIYALATLVYELLDRNGRNDQGGGWNRVRVSVAPGISALQAAAARIGAPLGHDFCAISLSDLLTLPEDIERRLRAAADGDFVVALYNPVSKRRRTQLVSARDILLEKRPPETPVILARNLGRADETVRVISLGDLDVDMVDMLTLVMIGSSQSRTFETSAGMRVYTPRGYEKKMDAAS
ncbi:MAG: precorrin-3B C(17)-methyltransferase [Rhodospirillales bacterium]|nr:precorrin-3B C(17)-methyltransferase [Alphaproteobacteria bacterium]MBL6948335.1 precorrin-3B C(17)-methyltransferase [Rhodospirillales bacterium]